MKKKLKLEILDPVGNTATTHHFFYNAGEGNRLRLTITDNQYIMDKDGKLVILTQEEIKREAEHKDTQQKLKYYNPDIDKMQNLFDEQTLIPPKTKKL